MYKSHKSSINFKPVKENSKRHNERIGELKYVHSDLTHLNETWKVDEINTRYKAIAELYKQKVGQTMQARATPIREAVVNLSPGTTMSDLRKLSVELEENFGIKAFQIHIHRDEGKREEGLNHHAHILFDWQDKKLGTSYKLKKSHMSKIQDLVAKSLGMERGENKENSNVERLEAVEYKIMKIQEDVKSLEQKKNEVDGGYREAEREYREVDEYDREVRQELLDAMESKRDALERNEKLRVELEDLREGNRIREEERNNLFEGTAEALVSNPKGYRNFSEEEIEGAISLALSKIQTAEEQLQILGEEFREEERRYEDAKRAYLEIKS